MNEKIPQCIGYFCHVSMIKLATTKTIFLLSVSMFSNHQQLDKFAYYVNCFISTNSSKQGKCFLSCEKKSPCDTPVLNFNRKFSLDNFSSLGQFIFVNFAIVDTFKIYEFEIPFNLL